jgi:phosphoribosylglycinamide formyltransferase-1
MVKKNACVFLSGAGTNLKELLKSSKNANFPININLIISSNDRAKGLNLAKIHKIHSKTINLKNRLQCENLLWELKKRKISLICLAGYMRVLSKYFINNFKGKIINIHPSLLPKYRGLNTFKRVLEAKERFTGCTVHYVNERLDSGKVILQKRILINSDDDEKSLKVRVQKIEYKTYSEAIIKIYS